MFENIQIEFLYSRGGKENKISFVDCYSNEDFKAILEVNKNHNVKVE